MSERQRSYERKEITAAHTELRQDSLQKELKLHDEMLQSALIDEKNIDSYFQNAFLSDNAQNDSYRHRGFESLLGAHSHLLLDKVFQNLPLFESKFTDLTTIMMDSLIQSDPVFVFQKLIDFFHKDTQNKFYLENLGKIGALAHYPSAMKQLFLDRILIPNYADYGYPGDMDGYNAHWDMLQKLFSKTEIEDICGARLLTPIIYHGIKTYGGKFDIERVWASYIQDRTDLSKHYPGEYEFLDRLLSVTAIEGDENYGKPAKAELYKKVSFLLGKILKQKTDFFHKFGNSGKSLIFLTHKLFAPAINGVEGSDERIQIQARYYHNFVGHNNLAFCEDERIEDFFKFFQDNVSNSSDYYGEISEDRIQLAEQAYYQHAKLDDAQLRALLIKNLDYLVFELGNYGQHSGYEYSAKRTVDSLTTGPMAEFFFNRYIKTSEQVGRDLKFIGSSFFRSFPDVFLSHLDLFPREKIIAILQSSSEEDHMKKLITSPVFAEQSSRLFGIFSVYDWMDFAKNRPDFCSDVLSSPLSEATINNIFNGMSGLSFDNKYNILLKAIGARMKDGSSDVLWGRIISDMTKLPDESRFLILKKLVFDRSDDGIKTTYFLQPVIQKELLRKENISFFRTLLKENKDLVEELFRESRSEAMTRCIREVMSEVMEGEHIDTVEGFMRLIAGGIYPTPVEGRKNLYEGLFNEKNLYESVRKLERVKGNNIALLRDFFLRAPDLPPDFEKLLFDIVKENDSIETIQNLIQRGSDGNKFVYNNRAKFFSKEIFSDKNMILWPKYVEKTDKKSLSTLFNNIQNIPVDIEKMLWQGLLSRYGGGEIGLIFSEYSNHILNSGERKNFLLKRLFPEDDFYAAIKEWESQTLQNPVLAMKYFLACGNQVPEKYKNACLELLKRFTKKNTDIQKVLAHTYSPSNSILGDLEGMEDIEDEWVKDLLPDIALNSIEARKIVTRYLHLNNISSSLVKKESIQEICRKIREEKKNVENIPLLKGRHVILIYPVEESMSAEAEKNIRMQQQGDGKLTVLNGKNTTREKIIDIMSDSMLPLTIMYDGHSGETIKLDKTTKNNPGHYLDMEGIATGLIENYKKKFTKNPPKSRQELPILAMGGCAGHIRLRDDLYSVMQRKDALRTFPTLLLETEYGQSGMITRSRTSPMGSYFFENVIGLDPAKISTIGTYIEELQRRKNKGERLAGEHPLFTQDPITNTRYELTQTESPDNLVLPA